MRAIVNVGPGGATGAGFSPTEIVGASGYTGAMADPVVAVPPVEPGWHPPPDHHQLLLEGAMFGLAVGGVYVVSRTLYELRRFYRPARFIL
jgi:hypothetical protein